MYGVFARSMVADESGEVTHASDAVAALVNEAQNAFEALRAAIFCGCICRIIRILAASGSF